MVLSLIITFIMSRMNVEDANENLKTVGGMLIWNIKE